MTADVLVHPAVFAAIDTTAAELAGLLDDDQRHALLTARWREDGLYVRPARPGQVCEGYAPLRALQRLVLVGLGCPDVRAGLLVGVWLTDPGIVVRGRLQAQP